MKTLFNAIFVETDGYNPEEPALTAVAPTIPHLPPPLILPRLPIRPRFPGAVSAPIVYAFVLTTISKQLVLP